jgi:hypothetical protein
VDRPLWLTSKGSRHRAGPQHGQPESQHVIERLLPSNVHGNGEADRYLFPAAEGLVEKPFSVDFDRVILRDVVNMFSGKFLGLARLDEPNHFVEGPQHEPPFPRVEFSEQFFLRRVGLLHPAAALCLHVGLSLSISIKRRSPSAVSGHSAPG